MTKEEFIKMIASKKDVLLIDIREPEELLEDTTVLGSTNVPMGKMFTAAADGLLPRDKPIVVFCRSGKRATIVASELSAAGFNIRALEGGLQQLHPFV